MAQHQSRSEIIVGGRTDSTFFQMVNNINDFGMQLTHLTEGLRQFGTDALEVYRKYEDGMLETRSVLYKQYSSGELNKVMSELEKNAQKWASTTIFHTDDVANAMAEAAHAGWDYEKILEGIPSAMLIAQAGGLELSDSVDMLAKMLAATGTAFSDSGKFIDQWARSSDLVATDIGEMGEAFLRLGAAAQFADSNEELFTMLAVLAQVGTTGSNAGTAVRNMMVRLIAPTEKAAAAMEELGISDDEVAEAFEGLDAASAEAYERLKEFGFDPYDEHGNLKGFIEIFTDLNAAIEELPDEQEQNKILSAIFPTRTLAYAKAMLAAVKDGSIFSIYDAIYGDSEGYAQGKSDILMSGITGDLELLASKWEETKRRIGESLSPDVSWGAEILGGMLDKINGLDPILLNALVGAFEALAVAGPMMTLGAGGFSKIAALVSSHPVGTLFLLAAMGVTAYVKALNELDRISVENYREQFGDMDLETDPLMAYVRGMTSEFGSAFSSVDAYTGALETAMDKYQTAASTFSSKLTTAMITGTEMTDADVEQIKGLGTSMGQELINGINAAFDANTEYRVALLGEDSITDPTMQALAIGMQRLKNDMVGKAGELGESLGALMDEAFSNKIVTGKELDALKEKVDAYNAAWAELQAINDEAKILYWENSLEDSQNVNIDSFEDFVTQANDEFRTTEEEAREEYRRERAYAQASMQHMIDNNYVYDEETEELWSKDRMDEALKIMDDAFDERMKNYQTRRAALNMRTLDALFAGMDVDGMDLGGLYSEMKEYYEGHDVTYADQIAHLQKRGEEAGELQQLLGGLDLTDMDEETRAYVERMLTDLWHISRGEVFQNYDLSPAGEEQEAENLTALKRMWAYSRFVNAVEDRYGLNEEALALQEESMSAYDSRRRRIHEDLYGTKRFGGLYSRIEDADAEVEALADDLRELGGDPEKALEETLAMLDADTGAIARANLPGGLKAYDKYWSLLAFMGGLSWDLNGSSYLASTGARAALGLPAFNEGGYSTGSLLFGETGRYSDEALAAMEKEAGGLFSGLWRIFSTSAEAEEYGAEEMARTIHQYTSDELAAMQAEYAGKYGKANGIWAMFGIPNPFARAGEGTGTGSLLGLLTSGLFNHYTEGLNGKIPGTLGGTGVFASGLLAAILSGGGMLNAGGIGGIPYQSKLAQLIGKGNPYLNGLEYLVSTGARGAFGLPAYNEGGFSTSSIVFGDAGEYAEEQMAEMQEAADAEIEVELLPTPDGTETAQVFIADAQAMLTSKPGKWTITPIMGGGIGGGRGAGGGGGLGTLFGASGGGPMYLPTELQYAEGGRATTASIFGEAGAEWAIPEEHSTRTAALLDAARRASGFTWGEILAAYGGLNAGGGSGGQLVYSPTIYAGDARGVKEALAADKARLDKWWRDKERRDSLEVYA